MKWLVWSINLGLAEEECQMMEIQLEDLKSIENLLELLVSTKILPSDFM